MHKTIIIADLHLSPNTPELNTLLMKKLKEWCGRVDALYLLGDIYEVWIGNDYQPAEIKEVNLALYDFSLQTPLYLMHGNRDFLMDKPFAKSIGAQLIPDPSVVHFYGKDYILTHGDKMCTDDVAYQRFRKWVRSRLFKWVVLRLSLSMRLKLAKKFRLASATNKQKPERYQISDITELGLTQLCQNMGVSQTRPMDVIHGHTHRPAIHQHSYKELAYQRMVIPDWYDAQGGAIILNENQENEMVYFSL